jgi:hypothetical protein
MASGLGLCLGPGRRLDGAAGDPSHMGDTMGIFAAKELGWRDETFVIPARRMMGAIAAIEDVITLHELQLFAARKTAPMAKLAMAYGAVLRYAGASIADDDVYAGMLEGGQSATGVAIAISGLLEMMVPPGLADAAAAGAPPKGNSRKAAAPMSKRRTSSRSARRNGSAPPSSGS